MRDEKGTLCDLWEAEPPVHPPHSRLCYLEPIGVGSPLVESLTSYVARLSAVHCVSPSTLLRTQIVPLLAPFGREICLLLRQRSITLNGPSRMATLLVQALSQLTLRGDLTLLTMLPYKEVLSRLALLRRSKAWCSCCLENWRESGQIIYEPLLWMLSLVTFCPHHAQPLESQCPNPDCLHLQMPLAARCQPGYCTWCGQWLGSEKKGVHLELTEREQAGQLQGSQMVAALLAATCDPSQHYLKETFALTLLRSVNHVASGKISVFARGLQVQASTVWQWQHGPMAPQLEMLVKIAAFLNTSLFDLLTGQVKAEAVPPTTGQVENGRLFGSREPHRRSAPKEGIREALEATIRHPEDPPASVPQVASRLGYIYSQLRKDFPDLCQLISTHYANYRTRQRIERRERLCEEVRQAILLLHSQGRYPSMRQLSKILSTPGCFWIPEVCQMWKEMVQQLGWRQ